jgi:hypothetical protein
LLKVTEGDLLGCETLLEAILDLLQADVTVEQPKDEILLVMEAIILQADRLLDDPISRPLVMVTAGMKVRAFANG